MNLRASSVMAWNLHRSVIAACLVYFREIDPTAFWEFCNTIGTFRTLRDVRLESGMRTKADVRPRLWIYGLHWRRKLSGALSFRDRRKRLI
jgi:hypothetical protein